LGSDQEDETRARPGTTTPGGGSAEERDIPDRIGPYKILQVLGSGGMGVVYLADQLEPVTRRVALKVVKLGMDTKEVLARFEAERQALALMDHPGIARAFDAGATSSGRPYFAMELVRGIPLTDYCDKNHLRVAQRVELFIEVCRAVHHAHQKGVIHRDLKPTNVLVTFQDDRPVPKIIDFGIAKAMDRRLTDRTLVTEIGSVIGTPAYMSPEQLEVTGLDVDTRADIFSLGVMLYEVLTGTLPRGVTGGAAAALHSLRTADEDPPVPSARVSALKGKEGAKVSLNRGTATLRRELKGDLDWITLKAMARNRTERYEAASGLAADLQRYLRNETVVARPPSNRYRMGKFVRRNRTGVAVAVAAAALLVGFAVAMTVQATRVARERDRAEREAARVSTLNRFMTDMLGSANPWGEGGQRNVTVVEALQKSAGKVDQSFTNEPLLAATARQAIGTTFAGLGRLDDAEPLLKKALEARKAALGPTSPEVAESLQELAGVDRTRGRYDEAVEKHREVLAIRERLDGPDSEPMAEALTALTQTLFLKGEYDEAEKLAQRALSIRRKLDGQRSAKAADSLYVLAKAVSAKGDYPRAEGMVRECLAIQRETKGLESIEVAQTLNDLAVIRVLRNDLKEAEALYRESLALNRKILGEEHPEVASTLENLGGVLFRTGRQKETLKILDEVLAIRRKGLGDDSLAVARTLHNRSVVQSRAGELAAAEAGFRESISRLRQALGADHPEMAQAHANYARLLRDKKDYPAAEKELREGLAIAVRKLGPEHAATAGYELDLGDVLALEGRFAEAEPLLKRGFAAAEAGSDTRNARRAAEQLVEVYKRTGRTADVEAYQRKLAALPTS
jgi:eukaryotic-like serine/threonine-protein kinase